MKKLLIALSATALVMTACQKEPSFEDPNGNPGSGGGGAPGTKLARMGVKIGADSITANFNYQGDYISKLVQEGTINGLAQDAQIEITRNAANLITKTNTQSSVFTQLGLDSIVMHYTIEAGTNRYINGVSKYELMGEMLADSIVYSYDGSGKLLSVVSYFDDGTGYVPDTKEEYTYSGNNIATLKSYSYDTDRFVLDETSTFEYDSKINPLLFQNDGPVLGMTNFYPANNITKTTVVATDPPQTSIAQNTYTYDSTNRPTSSLSTDGGITTAITYYYQ